MIIFQLDLNKLLIIHQRELNYINSGATREELFNYLQHRPFFGETIRNKLLEFLNMARQEIMQSHENSFDRPLSDQERSDIENDVQSSLDFISNLSLYELYNYLQSLRQAN